MLPRNDRLLIACLAALLLPATIAAADKKGFTEDFGLERCTFATIGDNPWFVEWRVQSLQSHIPDHIVVVPLVHAVVHDAPDKMGKVVIVCKYGASIPIAAKVL